MKLYDLEEERLVLTSGMCFGEWAIIYNTARQASAFALEDTEMFYLEKEEFEVAFSVFLSLL